MKQIVILSLSLGIISAAATGLLSWAYEKTKAPIAKTEKEQNEKALKEVLPEFDNAPLNEMEVFKVGDREFQIYPGKKADKLVGYAIMGKSTKGFAGDVKVLVGFELDGKFRRVVVTDHKETPGLGTNVTDRIEVKTIFDLFGSADDKKEPTPSFIDQYNGKKMEDPEEYFFVKKDGGEIDEISGATVTSRAVTDAVSRIGEAYLKYTASKVKKDGGEK